MAIFTVCSAGSAGTKNIQVNYFCAQTRMYAVASATAATQTQGGFGPAWPGQFFSCSGERQASGFNIQEANIDNNENIFCSFCREDQPSTNFRRGRYVGQQTAAEEAAIRLRSHEECVKVVGGGDLA